MSAYDQLIIKQKLLATQITDDVIDEVLIQSFEETNRQIFAEAGALWSEGLITYEERLRINFRAMEILAKISFLNMLVRLRREFNYEDESLNIDVFSRRHHVDED